MHRGDPAIRAGSRLYYESFVCASAHLTNIAARPESLRKDLEN
jgi:hypothetical protein